MLAPVGSADVAVVSIAASESFRFTETGQRTWHEASTYLFQSITRLRFRTREPGTECGPLTRDFPPPPAVYKHIVIPSKSRQVRQMALYEGEAALMYGGIVICRAKRGKRDLRDLWMWTQVRSVRKKTGGSPVGCSRNTTARKDGERMRIEDSGGNHVTPDGPGQVPEGVQRDPEEAGGSRQTPLEPNTNVTDCVEEVHIPEGNRVTGSGLEGGRGNRD
ncbi:hypothetical protein DFH07DRAFT_945597 [Mycena maculata]|uniref:Uncharacterized protein n=1 Tax=Mycena maculata TaxID=230809 RepID=A0AAD7HVS2_9AGAR|nr:hypothetical protein DFH07DRAFT_945597 [Mycena maculata]